MGRGRLGNMHQKQPATAAGGKACGGLLQHIHRSQHLDAETQPDPAETVSSAYDILLQGGSHTDLERGSFQTDFDALQFKSVWKEGSQQQRQPPQRGKRGKLSCTRAQPCWNRENSWLYWGWDSSPLCQGSGDLHFIRFQAAPWILQSCWSCPCEQMVLSSFSNFVQ